MGLIDSIIGAESGGDPNARNSRSSASGAGQFIDSTWLDTLRKARPDIAEGKSDQDLIALKTDPQLSRQMTEAYAAQNGAILKQAGHEATPGNTYLAHFAGPQGAVSVLSADPSAPVSSILTPGAISANPFLKGMTAGDLRAWADRKMGGQPAPQAAQAPHQAIPAQPAPIMPQQAQAPQQAPQAMPQAAPQAMPEAPSMNLQPMAPPPPIFAPAALPIDIASLLRASGNRGRFFGTKLS